MGKFAFGITSYTDDTYDHESGGSGDDSTTNSMRAGALAYLAIEPSVVGFDHSTYEFAVKNCVFENTNQGASAVMFDHSAGCSNDFVDLKISYANNQWRVQHKLFVFGDGSLS